jgi:hypothetical protein
MDLLGVKFMVGCQHAEPQYKLDQEKGQKRAKGFKRGPMFFVCSVLYLFFNFLCGENGEQRHSFSYAIPDIVCTLIWVPAKMSTSQTFDLKIIILVTNHAF